MKIKTWLLLTYFLVMLLPLVGVYGLYLSITAYYQDKNVSEYFEKWGELQQIKKVLNDPGLYKQDADFSVLQPFTSNQVQITLYSGNGFVYYSSNPLMLVGNAESSEIVLKNLYEFKQNYRTFVYKEPVYVEGKMVGIFEVTLLRTKWVEQVNTRSYVVAIGIVIILAVVYSLIVYFLNRRLNRPVKELIAQMRAYAKGQSIHSQLYLKKDELGELAWSFKAMQQDIEYTRKQLEQEQQQKEFMIASLSHDLKTPLTSIQTYAESLRATKLTEQEQQEYLAVISSKSDYMKQMLDDLMMYTLLQSQGYELELIRVEGSEFFEMLLADYEQVCKEKGFHAQTTIHVSGNYDVNPKQLMRVMDNLVSNAWMYTKSGGSIELGAFEMPHMPSLRKQFVSDCLTKTDGIYIVVQNSGEGITPEECAKLFDPLYQSDQSRSKIGQRGAGLGLSIAKQIIEKHQGTIEVVSKQQQGTAIICWLPEGG